MISPTQTTTYYVRAEGKFNKTPCISATVTVHDKSSDPASVVCIGPTSICEGRSVQLNVKGGKLSSDATWQWSSDRCGGPSVRSGESVTLSPVATTTYFVRGEGSCNTTNCASITISVSARSRVPASITGPSTVARGEKVRLGINGGRLGDNAEWQWYRGGCGTGRVIGTGSTVTVRPRTAARYYVKAVGGNCSTGSDQCAEMLITPTRVHRWTSTYDPALRKFTNIGLGLGVDWMQLYEPAQHRFGSGSGGPVTVGDSTIRMRGIGLRGEVSYYPLMKDYLTLGLLGAFTYGIHPDEILSNKPTTPSGNRIHNRLRFQRYCLGIELAVGFKPVKALMALEKSAQPTDFTCEISGANTTFEIDRRIDRETLMAGLRFGRYSKSANFDLYYSLTRPIPGSFFSFKPDDNYFGLDRWKAGAGFTWWKHSFFKLRFDMFLPVTHGDFGFDDAGFDRAAYRISFNIIHNWFY